MVADVLASDTPPAALAAAAVARTGDYRAFNLLLGDAGSLWYVSSRSGAARELAPGTYVLSKHSLDTPWPKVRRLRGRLEAALIQADPMVRLFEALADRTRAADHELPETGIPRTWESVLSAAFIVAAGYETRCSTLLALAARRGRIQERNFTGDGGSSSDAAFDW
ncbi:MAG: NRDE family protein [Pseudomonadota bacterium]